MPRFFSEAECFELADRQTEELFDGRQNLTKDESAIVWDESLTHEQKLQKLRAIRAGKRSPYAACPAKAKPSR